MSKFLKELKHYINNAKCRSLTEVAKYGCANAAIIAINSLGENARRNLEIGIVQDKLVKLGFNFEQLNNETNKIHVMDRYHPYINIVFWNNLVYCNGNSFYYSSPTWQEDLLTYVKELINGK